MGGATLLARGPVEDLHPHHGVVTMQLPAQETMAPNAALHSVFRCIPDTTQKQCFLVAILKYVPDMMEKNEPLKNRKSKISYSRNRQSNHLTVPHHNGPVLHPISAIQSSHAISFSPSKPPLVHSEKKPRGGQLEDPKASWPSQRWEKRKTHRDCFKVLFPISRNPKFCCK